jgi:uncharacterized membrane protein YesL
VLGAANFGKLGEHMKRLRNIGIIINLIGALATLGIMIFNTSSIASNSELLLVIGFYVWMILPFIVMIIMTFRIHRKGNSAVSSRAILRTSIFVAVSSVLLYLALMSSRYFLMGAFLPIFTLVEIAVVYWITKTEMVEKPVDNWLKRG